MKDIKNAIMHLKEHQTYPATKMELVKACNELKDFTPEDKKWFEDHLPEGIYKSAEEVMISLGLQKEMRGMDQMSSTNM